MGEALLHPRAKLRVGGQPLRDAGIGGYPDLEDIAAARGRGELRVRSGAIGQRCRALQDVSACGDLRALIVNRVLRHPDDVRAS